MEKLILVPIYAFIALFSQLASILTIIMEGLLAVLIIASFVIVVRIIVKEMHFKH